MRQLNASELELARSLIEDLDAAIASAAPEDFELRAALRRRIAKVMAEKSDLMDRKRLKKALRDTQSNLCARCGKLLPSQGTVLVGFDKSVDDPSAEARLICPDCAFLA